MSANRKKTAGQAAATARKQASHAANNAVDAAQLAAAPAIDAVEGVVEETMDTIKRVDPYAVSRGLSKTGQGFIALSIAATAATFAFTRFRKAREEDYVVEEEA